MAKLVIVKLLLTLATINAWFLVQLDINNTFLHSDLAEEVYMCLHLRYHHEGEQLTSNIIFDYIHRSIGLSKPLDNGLPNFQMCCWKKGSLNLLMITPYS